MKKGLLYLLVAFLVFSFSSCEKDEGPDYVGKWSTTLTEDGMSLKDVLTLTETTFEDIISLEMSGVFVEFMGVKGTMTVDGNNVSLSPNSVGMLNDENMEAGIVWYTEGDEEYDQLLLNFGGGDLSGEYEVNGDELTLKIDSDEDGTFSDDEITVYTRM